MPYSGSNWLNRLRSAKGFPADQYLNLEQFINLHNPDQLTDPITNDPNRNPSINPGLNRTVSLALDSDCSVTMSNILSELFVMENSQNLPKKKGIRKQPNPRNCVVSIPPIATSPINPANLALDDEDEDTCRTDLSAFSRTEVTVIDTSVRNWKFEKMLFRRKNVWKVRDMKCKGVDNVDRKKRNGSSFDAFRSEKKSKLCADYQEENKGLHHNDRVEEVCDEGVDDLTQISKTSLHSKLKKGSSSVILVKNIPLSKKNGKSTAKC